jgi:deoxyribonuclease-1-like protein
MRFYERTDYFIPRLVMAGFVFAAVMLVLASGCDPSRTSAVRRLAPSRVQAVGSRGVSVMRRDWSRLRLASVNLLKLNGDPEVLPDVLAECADAMRSFDLIVVQQAPDASILLDLLRYLNETSDTPDAPPPAYEYLLGPAQGPTKRHFAFLYNEARIHVDQASIYTLRDDQNLLQYKPLVARFAPRIDDAAHAFSFTMVNAHIHADRVAQETDLLWDALVAVKQDGSGEDDIILAGPFAAHRSQIGRLAHLSQAKWIVPLSEDDKSRGVLSCNLIVSEAVQSEYRGGGILALDKMYGPNSARRFFEQPDMYPVWAEFDMYEGNSPGPLVRGGYPHPVR